MDNHVIWMEEAMKACAIFMGEIFLENSSLEKWGCGWRWEIKKKSQDYLQSVFPKTAMLK